MNLPPSRGDSPVIRIFGVGKTGLSAIELLIADGLSPEEFVAVNLGGTALECSSAAQRLRLETKRLRGLGSGGDPARGRQAAEEKSEELKRLCEGVDLIFIVTGLGGGSGTGISPVLARAAKEAGARVLVFATTPFDCEGDRRQEMAHEGLEQLREATDGVICLPNQKLFRLIEENTTALDTFKIADRLLATGVLGFWRLLSFKGLIDIHFDDLSRFLQDRHAASSFAVAESAGPDRVQLVLDRLAAHPLLEEGAALSEADAVLVSVCGGTSLTMAEVNRVIEQIKAKCGSVELVMGACVDERLADKLAVTLICNRKGECEPTPRGQSEELRAQLLSPGSPTKPGSRFLPPAPTLPPEQVQQLLSKQAKVRGATRRNSTKMRQGQLPLEIVSKGRFDKSEPTIHRGEDLDVPTYIRRGVPLN
ncbi:MAG TPA: cell division protein FtsZ [Verrucomicrobiae bacterium]|nr:cell division protein FtsZ [Verrucomicrobiae bacterium]